LHALQPGLKKSSNTGLSWTLAMDIAMSQSDSHRIREFVEGMEAQIYTAAPSRWQHKFRAVRFKFFAELAESSLFKLPHSLAGGSEMVTQFLKRPGGIVHESLCYDEALPRIEFL
jgi:hypothetical protein